MQTFKRYYEASLYLENLSNMPLKGNYMIDTRHAGRYLKRMKYFLDLIGNPEQGLKVIHITGTAGKGSVTNMIHEVIHQSGTRVGSFTSPSVSSSIERIKVGDKYIPPGTFADIVDYLIPYIDYAHVHGPWGRPSYFEISLAMAFIYFARMKCEWVMLEVGLGGRYDATNCIPDPSVTAITGIDYDHMHILGNTLTKIATDKSGIIKKGSHFFTTEHRPQLLSLFEKVCKRTGAWFHPLVGAADYTSRNVLLATAIARHIAIEEKYIRKGIRTSFLPGRFECIQKDPLVIIDGAHNRVKMRSTVENLSKLHYRKLHLIIGMVEEKDHRPILQQIIPRADFVTFTRFQARERKCATPLELYTKSRKFLRKRAKISLNLHPLRALEKVLNQARAHDLVLVTGSFFLAGELRRYWIPEEKILRARKPR